MADNKDNNEPEAQEAQISRRSALGVIASALAAWSLGVPPAESAKPPPHSPAEPHQKKAARPEPRPEPKYVASVADFRELLVMRLKSDVKAKVENVDGCYTDKIQGGIPWCAGYKDKIRDHIAHACGVPGRLLRGDDKVDDNLSRYKTEQHAEEMNAMHQVISRNNGKDGGYVPKPGDSLLLWRTNPDNPGNPNDHSLGHVTTIISVDWEKGVMTCIGGNVGGTRVEVPVIGSVAQQANAPVAEHKHEPQAPHAKHGGAKEAADAKNKPAEPTAPLTKFIHVGSKVGYEHYAISNVHIVGVVDEGKLYQKACERAHVIPRPDPEPHHAAAHHTPVIPNAIAHAKSQGHPGR